MSQSNSSEPAHYRTAIPWFVIVMTPVWLLFALVSVAFPHKTFHLFFLDVPMTPLVLFFVSSLIIFVDALVIEKEAFGSSLNYALVINFLVFLPLPITWLLLSFYEVSTLPSFLSVAIFPIIVLIEPLKERTLFRNKKTSPTNAGRIQGISEPLRLMGFYVSGLFFGYGTIVCVTYLFCYLTNQSFELFARANPAIILLGGATIMAGILALSKPSR